MIGNSLPRRCGIATFTTDLQRAVAQSRPTLHTCIVAMTDHGQDYDHPASVTLQIKDDTIEEYVRAAAVLNAGRRIGQQPLEAAVTIARNGGTMLGSVFT